MTEPSRQGASGTGIAQVIGSGSANVSIYQGIQSAPVNAAALEAAEARLAELPLDRVPDVAPLPPGSRLVIPGRGCLFSITARRRGCWSLGIWKERVRPWIGRWRSARRSTDQSIRVWPLWWATLGKFRENSEISRAHVRPLSGRWKSLKRPSVRLIRTRRSPEKIWNGWADVGTRRRAGSAPLLAEPAARSPDEVQRNPGYGG